MGINSTNVYAIFHVHKFKEDLECRHAHEDIKLIGIFPTQARAREIKEAYKNLPGFKEFPDAFRIVVYSVNNINKDELERSICKSKIRKNHE